MQHQSLTGLAAQGFRLVFQAGEYRWVHPLEVRAGAVDCTDMDDAHFERFVLTGQPDVIPQPEVSDSSFGEFDAAVRGAA